MPTPEAIKNSLESRVPGIAVELVPSPGPSGQHSLRVGREHLRAAALFLRDDPGLKLDYLSNLTAVDWLDTTVKETRRTREVIDGVERLIDRTVERVHPGYLEVVYHLYSVALRHGPVILRVRTPDRKDVHLPSVVDIWRSAEFQEREAYDLYGIVFDRHPDLRRILMWDGFADHPMRKDYVSPDDYEYEPTPHGKVLERVQEHPGRAGGPQPP